MGRGRAAGGRVLAPEDGSTQRVLQDRVQELRADLDDRRGERDARKDQAEDCGEAGCGIALARGKATDGAIESIMLERVAGESCACTIMPGRQPARHIQTLILQVEFAKYDRTSVIALGLLCDSFRCALILTFSHVELGSERRP